MRQDYGQCRGALLLLHGGAGGQDPRLGSRLAQATEALGRLAARAMTDLTSGADPLDVVVTCLNGMESDAQFNAGVGAALQADGVARLTAALMDGERQTFSAVMGVCDVQHPSLIAKHLQSQKSRVVAPPGTELLARRLGLPVESVVTNERKQAWLKRAEESSVALACDTVGCVVRAPSGRIVCGTSTGGRGFEFPGRLSDSGTVAGTYCSAWAAVSATGVGEEIVDDALAARIETRRRDGASLEGASRRAFGEAVERGRSYGWIALDRDGFWGIAHTTTAMSFVVHGASEGLVASS